MHYQSVILIDDDIDDRDLFCISVRDISPEIDCKQFANVADAATYLENTETLPEIIFTEIDIHLIDGIEFLEGIRGNEKLKDIPVYIYSTPFIIKEMGNPLKEQVTGYLFKTTNFADFERDLRQILERKPDSV
jgi:DNA-binding NtrC family response regulator